MHNDNSNFFDFTFDGDAVDTSAAGSNGGGGGGKMPGPKLGMVKYTDSTNATGDLSGMTGEEGVETALLLPAVQQAREAVMPEPESACGELHTIDTVDTWSDFFVG